ncbi:hypothetical protein ABSZ42_003479 [Salmonella enterica subsp. enterica serovar Newport]|nr:hypothetical protein [Salmonella enterica subsp. enterica serovar Newport]HAG2140091.1 hypothetical protein [Salmonella enterica]EBV5495309.1 hypothetical protein [Salmonella enterica subsp. enterica serovar Newport]ECD4557515.1 hypothetical protein [Salmonella enterica subsp. enterica serovar Newport]ECM1815407.1 hypothetical protein [Salmonella enterica subsp. enterica serovar Newport]
MHKSDAEKIESLIDKHDRIYRRQFRLFNRLGVLSFITGVLSVITALFSTSLLLKYTLCVVICVCLIYLVFMFFCLDRYIALSRQTLLWLMGLVEDTADVRRELLRRLLSGKTLTGRDEDDILRLWWESSNEVEELVTRQREQDAIRKFVGGDKSE